MRLNFKKILQEKNISSLVSNMTVAALGLVGFMLLTRVLTKEDFGNWVLFIALSTFFDLLRFGLTQNALVRILTIADPKEEKEQMGTSFVIQLKMQVLITLLCWFIFFGITTFKILINQGYELFLLWYPLLSMGSLGWNNAMSYFQAKQDFNKMMWVRIVAVGGFNLYLFVQLALSQANLKHIVIAHILFNLMASLWCSIKGWDGAKYFKYYSKNAEKNLIGFGRFSMGTLIGSSLLKSADTFIIGLSSVMGPSAIALYAIPLKLTDLLGIPLRSLTMTAYPKMAKFYLEGKIENLKKTFYYYSGSITLIFIPVILLCWALSDHLIILLGGESYKDDQALLNSIFYIFCAYLALLPIDRFTGVLLDSINKPQLNLYKVLFMAAANIIVDFVAVFVFQSLIWVALGTVAFTIIGIILGLYFLNKEIDISGKKIIPESFQFIKSILF